MFSYERHVDQDTMLRKKDTLFFLEDGYVNIFIIHWIEINLFENVNDNVVWSVDT